MNKTYIIAEAGVNHNGCLQRAEEMIIQAKAMGADAIKFQLFNADALVTRDAAQAEYQKKSDKKNSQYEMLKELELSKKDFLKLHQKAQDLNIDFIITPFDRDNLRFIIETLKLPIIKIGSGDITNGPLLLEAARSKANIILSSGMSTLSDIELALKLLAFGMLSKEIAPLGEWEDFYSTQEAQLLLKERVSILHCTTEYPAPIEEVNLKVIETLKTAFELKVGLSDHTVGIFASLAAVAREASIIEKHFTLDKSLPGPDHKASLDVNEFTTMIEGIRQIEKAIGHSRKIITHSEKKNIAIARRSLVAKENIAQGEVLSEKNIAIKRPQKGLSPMHYWQWLGKKSPKSYQKDEFIFNE